MDVREKLVELLKTNACPSPFMCDQACKYYGYGDCFPERFADHLIANGVTVQQWISVDDKKRKWKMKKRLIDANRLKSELRKSAEYHEERRLGYFSAIDHIDEQPTVDAVEVVRCKDCKWGKTWKNAFGIEGFKCDLLCVDLSPEAFCSYGVRKEGVD